jgi:SAM-dependent methyltransferase
MDMDYYEHNAKSFFAATVDVDMSPLYQRFLPLLPPAGRILDAGCGSGRDLHAFAELGYRVTAFDSSSVLVALAEAYAGQPVFRARFQDIVCREVFDGVWACASLLHLRAAELPDALRRLAVALVPSGVMYVSFKYGHGEREDQGRHFTDMDEAGLSGLLDRVDNLQPLEVWTTADQRPGRGNERWLNALLRRSESAPG